MPGLHPFLVHFPVALLPLALILEIAAYIWKNAELSRAAWWNQIGGTIGLALAVATGLLAKGGIHMGDEARILFERHEQLAFAASALFALLLFWRIASRGHIPGRTPSLFLLLLLCGVTMVLTGAWYGGEMVFRHGVGVR
jgi:uncharacterized membrane protein